MLKGVIILEQSEHFAYICTEKSIAAKSFTNNHKMTLWSSEDTSSKNDGC